MKTLLFPHQTAFYRGKVRDVYTIADKWLVMVASDRISAFDVILPRTIPYKGQVLNQIAAHMLKATRNICPNWLLDTPAPHVSIGKKCNPFRVEMVVRGTLTGHAWRTYSSGKRTLCGVSLSEGLRENDFFPKPIITPTTKAEMGHDEDISRDEIILRGIVNSKDYAKLEEYTLSLYQKGREIAGKQGLILADTKYEFGKIGDEIFLMDEIHTPDSSRYFYSKGYEQRQAGGEETKTIEQGICARMADRKSFYGKGRTNRSRNDGPMG